MWTERIDDSALLLAKFLDPTILDRENNMPVAAIVPHDPPGGKIGMTRRPQRGDLERWDGDSLVFIVGRDELPCLNDDTDHAQQLYEALDPAVTALGINPKMISGLSGLVMPESVAYNSPIDGGEAPDGRTRKILPFKLSLTRIRSRGDKRPRFSWRSILEVEPNQRRLVPYADHFILERIKSSLKPRDTYSENFGESEDFVEEM